MFPRRAEILSDLDDGGLCSFLVDHYEHLARALYKQKAIKAGKAHNTRDLKGQKVTMKWHPFLSTFVLNKMCNHQE
jgi:hypothetical protein